MPAAAALTQALENLENLETALISEYQIAFGSATLILYDHVICLDEEIEHFWTGRWTISRFLYLSIRYLGLTQALNKRASANRLSLGISVVTYALVALILIIPTVTLSYAVITLRVWYMFPHSPAIRWFAIATFALCCVGDGLLCGLIWKDVRHDADNPWLKMSPTVAWIFVPSLIIHSILFALKVYRFSTSPTHVQTNTLLRRVVKEGMFTYALNAGNIFSRPILACSLIEVPAALLFVVIALSLVSTSALPAYMIALGGSLPVATTVVSISRTMLNLQSLAVTAHVDPAWLLNPAELSRVHWRLGSIDGEIVVEANDSSIQLPVRSASPSTRRSSLLPEYMMRE
ncbi:hypothetical protein HYDPIDRAFT_171390 [Hydnomerulius pinastri MD-312]|uniref:DUF6533 domain-containing protein n=1 Tax=Hydnomerulius pinastri MD-312 TaxID=994086 RepID=A0A0C9W649_9AGAM|nr:hypothetical protein HYDPIDRAFT_171390 [Hydnomerulius pinastri MD-312]